MGSSGSHEQETFKLLEANFKCVACSRYLSCSPLKINTAHGGLMCGRCNQKGYVESEHLHNIFKNLKFPCNYHLKGCTVTTQFGDRNHEKDCQFFIYKICPVNNPKYLCNWTGTGFEILDHYKQSHPCLLLKDSKFDLIIGNDSFLYEKGKTLLLFRVKFDGHLKPFYFRISYLNSKTEIPSDYNLEFSSENSNNKITIDTLNKCTLYSDSTEDLIEYDLKIHSLGLGYSKKITVKVNFQS